MPKFHYKVALTDGTIATRRSARVYTHLIELSGQPLDRFVASRNVTITRLREERAEFDKSPAQIEALREARISEYASALENEDWRWTTEAMREQRFRANVAHATKQFSVENYAEKRRVCDVHIQRVEEQRDLAIADGQPFVGNYSALAWCGSLALAKKKLTSGVVKFYTDQGHTARIVATPDGQ